MADASARSVNAIASFVPQHTTNMNISGAASGLGTALGTALRGARAAEERFAAAATRVARVGTESPPAPDPVSEAGAAVLAAQETADLATEMVRARLAQHAYAANLATLRAADQIAAEALRLLR